MEPNKEDQSTDVNQAPQDSPDNSQQNPTGQGSEAPAVNQPGNGPQVSQAPINNQQPSPAPDVAPPQPTVSAAPEVSPASPVQPQQPQMGAAPNATQPQQANVGTMQPQPQAMNQLPSQGKSKKKLLLLAIPILLVVTVIGVLLSLSVFGSSIKLASYDGEDFSISYPEGYEEKERFGLTYFEEQDEEDDDTHSGVIVGTENIPSSLSAEQKELLAEQFEKLGDEFIETIPDDGQEIKNKQTDDSELGGLSGKRVSAELFEDGKKVGDLFITIGSDESKFALVAVLAHVSDPGVAKEAQTIMNSFKFKSE